MSNADKVALKQATVGCKAAVPQSVLLRADQVIE
jgi:hypothetical protein